jgi:hypothetical protein
MSFGEELYLALTIISFAVFGLTLMIVSLRERRWAKTHGRE